MKLNIPEDEQRVDELVAMIDQLMAQGDGHVNINAEELLENGGEGGLNVMTYRSSDCGTGACCQPNEAAPDEDDL